MIYFIEYPTCSTCKKAKKYLSSLHIEFLSRDIKKDTPTKEELTNWIKTFNLPIHKLFNTSGLVYKELDLKNKLQTLSSDEKIELLASNGMLIKRPLLITDKTILIGFKEEVWKQALEEK